jgi:hypothetical protein
VSGDGVGVLDRAYVDATAQAVGGQRDAGRDAGG